MAYRSTVFACVATFLPVPGLHGQSIAQAGPGNSFHDFDDSHFLLADDAQEGTDFRADMYQPLSTKLTPAASEKLRNGNYERQFDAARRKVRAWEEANVK